MAEASVLRGPRRLRRAVLFFLTSMAASMLAGPASSDDICSGSNPKDCQLDFTDEASSPIGVSNNGTSGTHDSPGGTAGGALNFNNYGASIDIDASKAASTAGEGIMDAWSIGGTGDDSGDAGVGGAVSMYNEGEITLDVNGASTLLAFLKVLSKGGDGDCCSNDDNDSDGGKGGAGGSAKIDSVSFGSYTLTGTISKAFYGLFAQSIGGTGGKQNDSVIGDQLGGRGGDAGTAEIDNSDEVIYGSSGSRVNASSSVSAIKAESIAGSGGFNNGDAGNAGAVTVTNKTEDDGIRLYLNMQSSGQTVYGISGLSQGGTGQPSSDNSDRGGNGGNGGDVTISSGGDILLDITGSATGAGAVISAKSQGGDGGQGPSEDEWGGSGGRAGNVQVNLTESTFGENYDVEATGDYIFGILAQSLGGQGGDGSDSTKVAGTGGGGGFGGNAGTVTVTTDSSARISTTGFGAAGIAAMSLGGGGGIGSDFVGILGGSGGNGGNGGNAGAVTVDNDADITTSGSYAYGILGQATAGSGGTGGVADGLIVELGGDGGAGGSTAKVDIDNDGEINTSGYAANGILAQSIGGGGGAAGSAGGIIAVGGNAPVAFTADGAEVDIDNTDEINTSGDAAVGMYGQSIGGGGGSAAGSEGIVSVGGQGSAGGDGGVVNAMHLGRITTLGQYAFGVLAQSVGGGGGGGGDVLDIGAGLGVGIGGSAGQGGDGGAVNVGTAQTAGTSGRINTSGYHSTALFAQSIGGGGGTGGDTSGGGISDLTLVIGGKGGGGGEGGTVTVNQQGLSVTTAGEQSLGIQAQSVGGGGGDGGGASAIDGSVGLSLGVAVGGRGGVGGDGGAVGVTLDGSTIATGTSTAPNDNSTGIFAQSVGGGGGTGGASRLYDFEVGVPVSEDGNTVSVALEMGAAGSGGSAGSGRTVAADLTDTSVTTFGQNSMGIHAQSVGGGGGSGGDTSVYSLTINAPVVTTVNLQAAAAVGGLCTVDNCGGGDGGDVSVNVGSTGTSGTAVSNIITGGDYANGILAQSVGGGGGNAGAGNASIYTLFSTVNAGVAVGVGSQGGAGGDGGTAEITLGANSLVQTGGSGARGIVAQSVGGGGGTGQGLTIYGTAGSGSESLEVPSVTLNVDVGMKGGQGGDGDAVTVTNDGSIVTTGRDSDGIVAQSIGGGGGIGGSLGGDSDWTLNTVSTVLKDLKDTYSRFSFEISGEFTVAVGGKGGTGGIGDTVNVSHNGAITTTGDYADGIVAQSIGGGGGQGGSSDVEGYKSLISANISVGGSGGDGGRGGEVDIALGEGSSVLTSGYSAYGILAQSIGGGGGQGGDGSTLSKATLNIGTAVGGGGGDGNDGGTVNFVTEGNSTVVTHGNNSHGIILQSVGNGGGTGGVGTTGSGTYLGDFALELAIGGAGGDAGNGGDVNVCNGSVGCSYGVNVTTTGDRAVGLLAQSVGGGGGVGGAGDPGGTDGLSYSLALDLGGRGGDGGDGGDVTINSGHVQVATSGDLSVGILAQSIGGGGGFGAAGYEVDSTFSGDRTLSINLGGSGGNGGDGHAVYLEVRPMVITAGDWAHAVVAQSIGGGGGVAGTSMSTIISGDQVGDVLDAKVIVGGAASGGIASGDSFSPTAGRNAVTVNLYDYISTQGRWAMATIAQSIGGGGGIGNGSMQADGDGTATANLSVGGGTGSSGDGGGVSVAFGTPLAISSVTSGAGAYAVLAQSIGGGGGLGTTLTSAFDSTLTVGGAGTGNGGSVDLAADRYIQTSGADAHGIVLQSIGGGGGVGAFSADGGTSEYSIQLGGADGASGNGGTVTSTATLGITTTGDRAFGLVAQSIGGGGGIAAAGPASEIHSPDDCCSASLTVGGQGNATGDGGAVNVTLEAGGYIVTRGNGSHAIVAQSIGGGGGIGGDPSNATLSLTPRGMGTGFGNGGAVSVDVKAGITTNGANAFGVIAQSIANGGGLGGDASGAFAGSTLDLDAYDASQQPDGCCTSGEVTVTVDSGISVSTIGSGSVGIFAQSDGHFGNGAVDVTVNGSVTGGSGDQGVGVLVHNGNYNVVTVGSDGSISAASGTAIKYVGPGSSSAGDELTVNNYGIITGNILLNNADGSSAGTVTNINGGTTIPAAATTNAAASASTTETAGILVGASLYEANVVNGGTLIVGQGGKTDGTEITGDFSQSSEGTLSLDLDMAAGKADRLTVRGDAALGGILDINAKSLLPGKKMVFLSVEGNATGSLETASNLAFDIDIAKAGQDYSLSASADFDRTGLSRSADEIADHLQEIWEADRNDEFGRLFAVLYDGAERGDEAYQSMLAGLLPGVSLAPAARFQQTIVGFNDSLMSCPKTSAGGLMLGETSCVWADISGGRFDQNGSSGYTDDAITYRMGTQVDLAPGWFLGLAGAYEHSSIDGDDGFVSGSGDAGFLGAALKREVGPWLFAGVISGSYGSYDMERIGIPGLAGSAESSPDVYGGALRFRVARTFAGTDYYVKPYLDLDAVYTRMSGYTESGAGVAGLKVEGSEEFAFVASPMIEIGGSVALGADYMLRPYAYVGASLSTADEWTADARLSGAPAGVGMFEASLPMDDVLFKVGAGLHLSKVGGMDIELQYAGAFSQDTSSNSGMLRLNVPF
jgi:hypothetical protein